MLTDMILFCALGAVLASADVRYNNHPFQYWAVLAIALALKYSHY